MNIRNLKGKLGFGCAGLSSLNNDYESIKILNVAFDEGITHFDVAPLYGMGKTEGILGKFIQNKRDQITITTKFGLNPPKYTSSGNLFFKTAKTLVKSFPIFSDLVSKKVMREVVSSYTSKNARISLEKSLKELKTDYVDYYFLHEANYEEAISEDLIATISKLKEEGKILEIGIGSAYAKVKDNLNNYPNFYKIFQFESDIINDNLDAIEEIQNLKLITHSALQLLKLLPNKEKVSRIIYEESGINSEQLSSFLLYYNYINNPYGMVLFSSTSKVRVKNNIYSFNKFVKLNPKIDDIIRCIKSEINGN
jgi:aryl-alcohol dehydrogenase-like predicted oxidoreductase